MIDALIAQSVNLVIQLVSIFPNANLTYASEISAFVTWFKESLAIADTFVPVPEMVNVMAAIMTFEVGLFMFRLWRFVFSHVTLGFLK